MAEIINMPKLSDTMEEGVVSKWLKKVGDTIKEGDILAEIETDKATMEFESFYSGTLLHIDIKEGDKASVDSLLAIIGDKNEDISAIIKNNVTSPKEETKELGVKEMKETSTTPKDEQNSKKIEPPKSVETITMPRLSDTMVEGTVSKWLKKVGDTVKEGDILAEIETDKATMEFESFYSGTLLHIDIKEGESTPIDALLALIGKKGTDVKNYIKLLKEQKTKALPPSLTEEEVAPPAPLETKQSLVKQVKSTERIFISPLARKMAYARKINIKHFVGTGEGKRIIKRDIENYIPQPSGNNFDGKIVTEDVSNSQMRKIIAKRLSESKFTSPHYYLNIEIDMSEIMTFRNQLNTLKDVKVSFNDLVVKACALSLKENPKVNSSWTDSVTKIHKHINVGVAVAIDDGLVVPVLNFTDTMSLFEIGSKVKELAVKANEKKLTPDEMAGSTFTVSNLGMYGIYEFTSIINQPNSAILSVGTIVEKPVVKNGQVIPGHTMKVTLSCDHRTVDGATGAVFLQSLKSYIENPITMIA